MAALARLQHPNIPFLLDYGEYRGLPYLVMALLRGKSRRRRLLWSGGARCCCNWPRRWPTPIRWGSAPRYQAANVVLREDGVVKLTDFGLARSADSSTLTVEGTLLGTPAYMAPEIVTGESASEASDYYSLACLALEMFTGQPPYQGDRRWPWPCSIFISPCGRCLFVSRPGCSRGRGSCRRCWPRPRSSGRRIWRGC